MNENLKCIQYSTKQKKNKKKKKKKKKMGTSCLKRL
jgi:hypothetical protein